MRSENWSSRRTVKVRPLPSPHLTPLLTNRLSSRTEYAQVTKMLGNGRLQAQCFDGETRLAHIRGKMRKKVWINQGDIILISLRDFQDDKADVIVKYTVEEVRAPGQGEAEGKGIK
jgi:initiation factor 1A